MQALLHPGNWSDVGAYRFVFGAYACLGIVKLALALMLSDKCEPEREEKGYEEVVQLDAVDGERLLSDDADEDDNPDHEVSPKPAHKIPPKHKSIFPSISPQSRTILLQLSALFAIDSLASGLVPLSWLTYFFSQKFSLLQSTLGTLFFTTSIIAAISNLLASSLSKRIGLVKTMVFTHLPSAIFLALIPLPSQGWLAMVFLVLRACSQNMDQAPRQAFLSQVVLPGERTAVMGWVNVVKTLSQSGGPVLTGWLAGVGKFWIAFLVAGGLKAGYDLAMLKMFLGVRGREEQEEERKWRGESDSGEDDNNEGG